MKSTKLARYMEKISLEDSEVYIGVGKDGLKDAKVDLEKPEVIDSESIDKDIDAALDLDPSESSIMKELETVQAVTVALEQYGDVLTQSLERGGLRPEEGQLLNVALEHFDRVLGLESGVLSMEDFGGKMSRREATQVSLENIGDKVKAAGKKAYEFVMQLIKKLTDLFNDKKARSEKLKVFLIGTAKEAAKAAPVSGSFTFTLPSGFDAKEITPEKIRNLKKVMSAVTAINVGFKKDVARLATLSKAMVKDEGGNAAADFEALVETPMSLEQVGAQDNAEYFPIFGKIYREGDTVKDLRIKIEKPEGEREVTFTQEQYKAVTAALSQFSTAYDQVLNEVAGHTRVLLNSYGDSDPLDWGNSSDKNPAAKRAIDVYSALAKLMYNIESLIDRLDDIAMDLTRMVRSMQKQMDGANKEDTTA